MLRRLAFVWTLEDRVLWYVEAAQNAKAVVFKQRCHATGNVAVARKIQRCLMHWLMRTCSVTHCNIVRKKQNKANFLFCFSV